MLCVWKAAFLKSGDNSKKKVGITIEARKPSSQLKPIRNSCVAIIRHPVTVIAAATAAAATTAAAAASMNTSVTVIVTVQLQVQLYCIVNFIMKFDVNVQ